MEEYKTIKEFEKRVRKGNLPSVVKVEGVIYTMDEYDLEGKYIHYTNRKKLLGLDIITKDRYKYGMGDAKVEFMERVGYRRDIDYYE